MNEPADPRSPTTLAEGPSGEDDGADPQTWELRLYVAGFTPKAVTAFANLKRICEDNMAGRYTIEIIDLVENPALAEGDQILAVPTLVRKLPEPIKRVIGDLSDDARVLVGLNLRPQPPEGAGQVQRDKVLVGLGLTAVADDAARTRR